MLLLLLLQLGAVPMPDPPPSPFVAILAQQTYDIHANDGPLANKDGWTCWRLETDEAHQVHTCACHVTCYGDTPMEDPWNEAEQTGCWSYCAPKVHKKCRCHADENVCAAPEVQGGDKK